jgi:hypothetical protein
MVVFPKAELIGNDNENFKLERLCSLGWWSRVSRDLAQGHDVDFLPLRLPTCFWRRRPRVSNSVKFFRILGRFYV